MGAPRGCHGNGMISARWRRVGSIIFIGWFASLSASAQISKLPHTASPDDFFGSAVAISSASVIVGASGENVCGPNSGAARIFDRDPSTGAWNLKFRLSCTDCSQNAFFGRDLALSGDVAVVAAGLEFFGSEEPGVAHVFEQGTAGEWKEVTHLRPADEIPGNFGTAVDVDSNRILVIASGDRMHEAYPGGAYIFERSGTGEWIQTARIEPMDGRGDRTPVVGSSGALHGDHLIFSGSLGSGKESGAVYIFERDEHSNTWLQRARFTGFSDANIAVEIHAGLAIAGDHDRSGNSGGSAHLFTRDASGAWKLIHRLTPSVSSQSGGVGTDVAVREGMALVVGYDDQLDRATNIDRVVFVFEPDAQGRWSQRHVIDIGETEFGAAIDMDAEEVVIGSSGDFTPGAAYVVRMPGPARSPSSQ